MSSALSAVLSATPEAIYGDAANANTESERRAFSATIVAAARGELCAADTDFVANSKSLNEKNSETSWRGSNAMSGRVVKLIPPWKQSAPTVRPFIVLQSWTGVVLERGNKELLVQLTDETARGAPLSQTSIRLSEIDEEDAFLAQPGAIFYWRIGYDDTASGRRRTSLVRFRRLPAWTQQELVDADKDAAELLAFFNSK